MLRFPKLENYDKKLYASLFTKLIPLHTTITYSSISTKRYKNIIYKLRIVNVAMHELWNLPVARCKLDTSCLILRQLALRKHYAPN
jgi:hypothetical protein